MNMTTSQATGLPASLSTANPSNVADKRTPERGRIPMSLPIQKLAAPEIPGFYTHWMRGDPQRMSQALRAGYTYVSTEEIDLNTFGLANGEEDSGNQDLGSRVSFISGVDEQGHAQSLYLMKLPLELRTADLIAQEQQQERVAAQLRGDKGFSEGGMDASHRYAGKQSDENKHLFQPKRQP